ncbi:carbohydrate kinase family protein [Mucilaginibacter sp. KACC 22063]|uniref:carbohydrate kinase family protein n=1 Tax=Mucilaginibacter sp. KACC 22063 TaxID=3025666 RepID=UPI002365B280|nr:carbohydrate kinase [Mucilaginibacter sp. KACC 22063]WDF56212.1 carbohydrate kinase [Mucilaginibacter sp. KACC 22063]
MTKKILCFGEVLWDTFGNEKIAGGAPMNVAWHLKQQGANVHFASRIGTDQSGHELDDFLHTHGLHSSLIQHDDNLPTCEVTVQLDANQHATYIIPEPVSWDNIQPEDHLISAAKQASAVIFGSLACRGQITRQTLFDMLDETTALTAFDVNLRAPHYELSTIQTLAAKAKLIKMNEDEADLLIGTNHDDLKQKIVLFQKSYHAETICVTRGDKGALLLHNNKFYEHDGVPVEVVDTVGAGDAFFATLIKGMVDNVNPQTVLENACKIGAFVAGKRGATPTY